MSDEAAELIVIFELLEHIFVDFSDKIPDQTAESDEEQKGCNVGAKRNHGQNFYDQNAQKSCRPRKVKFFGVGDQFDQANADKNRCEDQADCQEQTISQGEDNPEFITDQRDKQKDRYRWQSAGKDNTKESAFDRLVVS